MTRVTNNPNHSVRATAMVSALLGTIASSPFLYFGFLHGISAGAIPATPALSSWAATELSITIASATPQEEGKKTRIMGVVAFSAKAVPESGVKIVNEPVHHIGKQTIGVARLGELLPEFDTAAIKAPQPKPMVPVLKTVTAQTETSQDTTAKADGRRLVYAGRIDNSHLQQAEFQPVKAVNAIELAALPVSQTKADLKPEQHQVAEQGIIGADTLASSSLMPPWLRYAVASAVPVQQPKIAIVIDDLGLSQSRTTSTMQLPGPLTLAFLPYADNLTEQTKAAALAGHELLIHMPMEPFDANQDPGPKAMRVSLSEAELLRRLRTALSSFDGYVGINNHMGSKFTSNTKGMMVILKELQRRGLMFLDSQTSANSIAGDLAESLGMPTAKRSVFIDHERDPDAVRKSLAQLEVTARHFGVAVGIGHPHRVTLEALAEWLPTLEDRGIALVPISAVAKQRMEAQNSQVATR